MVYRFDPKYWNGTIFLFEEWNMCGDYTEHRRKNKPIPASYFPKSLKVTDASQKLPDMFHTNRNIIVFSERARVVMERMAPGEVEFIPVFLNAETKSADRLQLANAYYFINVFGRAQRLRWLEMPIENFQPREDGTEVTTMEHDFRQWKLRERCVGEPLIWQDIPLRIGDKVYLGQTEIFVENILWEELDAHFPDQLNAQRVGQK
ncbi:MAG: hypothetical protein ACLPPF_18805 [Rhodomicrobium sp.]